MYNLRKRNKNIINNSSNYIHNIYPYVATAIVKGKWNIKEYPILENLLKSYNIDKNIRGEII